MRICIVGTGYVGLVSGACLAEMGTEVTCVDVDSDRIDQIRNGILPFYEPGLPGLVEANFREGRLNFTTELAAGIKDASIIFLAVGTPSRADGTADLSAVYKVAENIGRTMQEPKIVATKSTVPVGTACEVKARVTKHTDHEVFVVSNPEFLKQGNAVNDFLKPERVIVGADEPKALDTMRELYAPFLRTGNPIITMDVASAEMTKYVANAFLATKISFMNEMSRLCEMVGADIEAVRVGIGTDSRIGKRFMFPGIGFGGSCLPKDNRALIEVARENNVELPLVQAALDNNAIQRRHFLNKLLDVFPEGLGGKTFAIWGLTFKPGTDDTREAPSLDVLEHLKSEGATAQCYDPQAPEHPFHKFGDSFERMSSALDACNQADALLILTEWHEFRRPDFKRVGGLLRNPIIIDGRNLYEPQRMAQRGFQYLATGRQATNLPAT